MTQLFELTEKDLNDMMDNSHLYCPLIDDPDFKYFDSASTDITRTWRRFGWKPLEELRNDQAN